MTFTQPRRALLTGLAASAVSLLVPETALAKAHHKRPNRLLPAHSGKSPVPVAEPPSLFSLFSAEPTAATATPASPAIVKLSGFASRGALSNLPIARWGQMFNVPLGSFESHQAFSRACADIEYGNATRDMAPELLDAAALILHDLGGSQLFVCSGYRTPQHQNALHRRGESSASAEGSMHPQGKALDIRIPGISNGLIARHLVSKGFGGVKNYGPFVHMDVRGHLQRF